MARRTRTTRPASLRRELRWGNAAVRLGRWHYSGEKRDLRLDLLRGLAAAAMIIDHVGGTDSWLFSISGGNRFFVSAAEGFVFISGLVMGLVYAGLVARRGLRAALVKGVRRVATLYGLAVGLALLFAGISFWFELPWEPEWTESNFLGFVGDIVTLHRTFYLTDVLLLYTLAVAAALPALVALARRKAWLVLAASWGLWAAWQWWPAAAQIPWPIADNIVFYFAAWQVLFVTGLVIGYQRDTWLRWGARLGRARVPLQGVALGLSGAALAGAILFYGWAEAHGVTTVGDVPIADLFGKPDLRAGRLAVFACLFVFAYLVTSFAWTPLRKGLGWLLLPLGQDALTVYTLHLFVLGLLVKVAPPILGTADGAARDNALRQAAALGLIWGLVQVKLRGRALLGATYRRVAAWPTGRPGRRLAAGIARGVAGAGLGRTPRPAGHWRPARTAASALALSAIVLVAAEPGFAEALKTRSSGALNGALAGAVPSAVAAFPVPSAVAMPAAAAGRTPSAGAAAAPAPASPVATPALPDYIQQRTFHSATLNRDLPYYILLPPSYAADPARRYPVLYMLHGSSGTNTEWLYYGLLGRAMDMMRAGQIGEFLIVLPQGDSGYWMDQANGGPRWGTYLAQDVVGEIDTHFRTVADRAHRAVGGLSMGGYGALTLAILNPTVFGVAGADSPSLHDQATAPAFFGDAASFAARDPLALYPAHPDVARTLTLWLDVGQQDPWLPAVQGLHAALDAAGIPHAWHLFPGDHGGDYWSAHVPDYLLFYSTALTGTPALAPPAAAVADPSPRPALPHLIPIH